MQCERAERWSHGQQVPVYCRALTLDDVVQRQCPYCGHLVEREQPGQEVLEVAGEDELPEHAGEPECGAEISLPLPAAADFQRCELREAGDKVHYLPEGDESRARVEFDVHH